MKDYSFLEDQNFLATSMQDTAEQAFRRGFIVGYATAKMVIDAFYEYPETSEQEQDTTTLILNALVHAFPRAIEDMGTIKMDVRKVASPASKEQ